MPAELIQRTATEHSNLLAEIEVPTNLPYLTKRNWSDALDYRLAQLAPGIDTQQYHVDQPCFFHVDFQTLIETVLQRVDGEGRVHSANALTGKLEVTEPIARQNFTGMTPAEQIHLRDLLARRLIESAGQIIRFQDSFAYTSEQVRHFTAHCEGLIAQVLTPYRFEPSFIADIAQATVFIQQAGKVF